ncbi:MAG: acyl-CoA dehydrogenase family protein [Steroidobacteraceae bacterium]
MHFSLSEQQIEMQDAVRRFLAAEAPIRRVHAVFDGDDGYDATIWRGLSELGVLGIALPIEHDGMGLELLDLALVSEAVGEAAAPGPFLNHVIAALAIAWAGDDAQRAKWLPRLASGELTATIAFAEAGAAWQPHEWTLSGTDTLNGQKHFVPYASKAELVVVGLQNGGFAVVERADALPECKPINGVDRTRRTDTVTFRNTPATLLSNSSLQVAGRVRDAALVLLAADSFGGASRSVQMAVDYANTREQFGVKIGLFQGLKYQIVNTAVEVEPARGLYWYAAHAFTHMPSESERMAALAKSHLTSVYLQATRTMVESHGGIGFTWEFDAHIYLKRAMFNYAFMGAAEVHQQRAIELAGWAHAAT